MSGRREARNPSLGGTTCSTQNPEQVEKVFPPVEALGGGKTVSTLGGNFGKTFSTIPKTRADKIIQFIERYCVTPEGADVGKPLVLAEFQKQFIRDVYDNPKGTRHVEQYLGDDLPDPMPEAIECAILLLTGDLYVNRERQSDRPIHENTAYQLLLAPYKSMAVL